MVPLRSELRIRRETARRGVVNVRPSLDVVEKVAVLAPSDGLTFTTPRLAVSLRILSSDRSGTIGALPIGLGTIEIHRTVTGFQTFDTRTRTSYGVTPLRLAPSILRTRGVWYCFEQNLIEAAGLQPRALPGSLHALEHAAIGMLPLFLICDRWDVGGVSTALQDELKCASVTIYDGSPGGSGIAELAFERVEEHLAATLEAIEACSCQFGCPSCVQSPKCGNGNEPLDKRGAACLARTGLSAS